MSSAPPPYVSEANPDTRPLPQGWITQFDSKYVNLISIHYDRRSADHDRRLRFGSYKAW